jgi:hypothetical protein
VVGLAEQTPPLGMSYQDVSAPDIGQHRARHFASVGSAFVLAQALRSKANAGPGHLCRRLGEIHEGGANGDFDGKIRNPRNTVKQLTH